MKIESEGPALVATLVNETGKPKQVRRGDIVTRDSGTVQSILLHGSVVMRNAADVNRHGQTACYDRERAPKRRAGSTI